MWAMRCGLQRLDGLLANLARIDTDPFDQLPREEAMQQEFCLLTLGSRPTSGSQLRRPSAS